MSTAGAAPPIASSTVQVDEGEDRVVAVYTCSRLGRTANPPGFSFRDFFRIGRFRRR
jgi:hypothetical protein